MMRTEGRQATITVNPNSPLATFRNPGSVTNGMALKNHANGDEPLIRNRLAWRKLYEQSKTHSYKQKF